MAEKELIVGQQYTIRELQAFGVAEMHKSIPEHSDREDPKVGLILVDKDYRFICAAHRGELRAGDHSEFTALERKCRDRKWMDVSFFRHLNLVNEMDLVCKEGKARAIKYYIAEIKE